MDIIILRRITLTHIKRHVDFIFIGDFPQRDQGDNITAITESCDSIVVWEMGDVCAVHLWKQVVFIIDVLKTPCSCISTVSVPIEYKKFLHLFDTYSNSIYLFFRQFKPQMNPSWAFPGFSPTTRKFKLKPTMQRRRGNGSEKRAIFFFELPTLMILSPTASIFSFPAGLSSTIFVMKTPYQTTKIIFVLFETWLKYHNVRSPPIWKSPFA